MNVEDTIRNRHAFEDRVKTFLELISVMTTREIEIALARLVDLLASESDEAIHANMRVKGELIKAYYNMRLKGAKQQRRLKRAFAAFLDPTNCLPPRKQPKWYKIAEPEPNEAYYIRCVTEVMLFPGKQIPPSSTQENPGPQEMVKLLSP